MSYFWKSIIESETPDGLIFIDERTGSHVMLTVDDPDFKLKVLCRDILDEIHWSSNSTRKFTIQVGLQ